MCGPSVLVATQEARLAERSPPTTVCKLQFWKIGQWWNMPSQEKPIIFSSPMARAILQGRKTQTRRVIQPTHAKRDARLPRQASMTAADYELLFTCPYGAPGDRLWVKETFYNDLIDGRDVEHVYYLADSTKPKEQACCDLIPECCCGEVGKTKWKPSIHMPRWASRITLEITGVRVQRLQDISEEDAKAEGAQEQVVLPGDRGSFVAGFYFIWDGIHHKNDVACWDANPWVWVMEFKMMGSTV